MIIFVNKIFLFFSRNSNSVQVSALIFEYNLFLVKTINLRIKIVY